ncbi:MAG: hypothetical protein LBI45_05170 [Bacteroidales bacterium]|jgi:hypothetical protein|nr:hypothetical protein [Bacteroidales bacterium]
MNIERTENEKIIARLFNSRADGKNFIEKRVKLIEEAINFQQGTFEEQVKTVIKQLINGKEVYFLKPGKETLRKVPNIHDMSPNVAHDFDRWAFEQIWEYLIKISIIQQAAFKKILVLLYRLCYFTDHKLDVNNNLRYLPSQGLLTHINNLELLVLRDGFTEKFKTEEVCLLEFLNFIDILAWNEDVKYHSNVTNAVFSDNTKKNVGRVNTILTLISAPILISKFISNIIESTKTNGVIDVKLITTTIQKFTKTRGLCILSNPQLLEFLQPYLEK